MRRDRVELGGDDVENDQRVEPAQGSVGPGRIGEGGEGVAARDEQHPERPALDLVGERHARVLPEPTPQVGPLTRSRLRGLRAAPELRPVAGWSSGKSQPWLHRIPPTP